MKAAIDAHSDTWYGDGVQVGAFARAQLAALWAATGKTTEAKAMADEIVERFPGAVDRAKVISTITRGRRQRAFDGNERQGR